MYDTPSMGSIYYALTGTLQSNTATYTNIAANGGPIFQWPRIATGVSFNGTPAVFVVASPTEITTAVPGGTLSSNVSFQVLQ